MLILGKEVQYPLKGMVTTPFGRRGLRYPSSLLTNTNINCKYNSSNHVTIGPLNIHLLSSRAQNQLVKLNIPMKHTSSCETTCSSIHYLPVV